VPLASNFLLPDPKNPAKELDHNLSAAALRCVRAACAVVPWSPYLVILQRFLRMLGSKRNSEKSSKVLLRVVISVLEGFHFEANTATASAADGGGVVAEGANDDGAADAEEEDGDEGDDDDDEDAMQATAPTARDLIVVEHVSPALIMNTMTKEILPKLCVVIAPCTHSRRHRPHARIHVVIAPMHAFTSSSPPRTHHLASFPFQARSPSNVCTAELLSHFLSREGQKHLCRVRT
jgi:hypothetical protein